MEAPTESRGVSKQKWLDGRKKKIGKLLDANGLDMTKAYMLDTQEAAEEKYKKWEKDPAPSGWDGMFFLYSTKKCYCTINQYVYCTINQYVSFLAGLVIYQNFQTPVEFVSLTTWIKQHHNVILYFIK